MDAITTVRGHAAAIHRANIDTDQIISAKWMKRIERTGYEDGLFAKWRTNPNFILNHLEREGVSIIIAGPNFGCGSSRQHAVWALRDYGIKAIISPSIADIHRTNLPEEGLVPVEIDQAAVDRLMKATDENPATIIEIDLTERTVTCETADLLSAPFHIDSASQYNLVNGLDPIGLTLTLEQRIAFHETKRDPWLPECGPFLTSV